MKLGGRLQLEIFASTIDVFKNLPGNLLFFFLIAWKRPTRRPQLNDTSYFLTTIFLCLQLFFGAKRPRTWFETVEVGSQDGVKLAEIQALDRLREPDEMADQLMLDAGMIHPRSLTVRPWKMVVGRLLSYWEGNFSGASG